MSALHEAAQLALEALEYGQHSLKQISEYQWESRGQLAMDALKAALDRQPEPAQEPVAWMYPDDYAGILKNQSRAEVFQKAWCNPAVCVPLYTAPQPQRSPLTDEEIDALPWNGSPRQFARAVERKVRGE